MHKRFVFNVISRIVLVVSIIMAAPLAWAIYDDPGSLEVRSFLWTMGIGITISGLYLLLFRLKKEDHTKINAKDALAMVGLSWIALSALGALPLVLSHTVGSYTDAFFEIVSGFTTTGATVITDIEALPRGILFWRSLTHWLGGMGIIVLYIALLPAIGANTYNLYKAEAPGLSVERVEPRIKDTAKNMWNVYFLLTFFETCLLMFGGMSLFDALCHTFGTMATGGFSTMNASIGAFGGYIQWVIIVFMFLAGVNFILHYQAFRGHPKAIWKNEEFRVYSIITLVMIAVFAFGLRNSALTDHFIRDAAFHVVSILTTTGFTSTNFDLWPNTLRFLLIVLMFIGGCGGSTGGGMKVIRFLLSIKIAVRAVVQSVFPNAVIPVKFNGKSVPDRVALSVAAYFIIFIVLFFAGAIVFEYTESCDLETAFSASIASLSNIGPGLSRVGAVENYGWVSPQGKWTLIFLMLAGRLELYSILVLFIPATWRK